MIKDENLEVISALKDSLSKNETVALCIIVEKEGSGPRGPGAKMLVYPDGRTVGTIGGGPFERMVIKEAIKAIREGKPRTVRFAFREDNVPLGVYKTGLICGGILTVFIDVFKPKPRVIVLGVGHVGKPLAKLLAFSGFRVWVVDDNPKHAKKEYFPDAEEIIVDEWEKAIDRAGIGENDFVLIVHGAVEYDYKALKKAIEAKAKYIGLLGSRTKISKFLERLDKEGVQKSAYVGRLYAPVGLDIGAKTPEEIAVSIVAEILKIQYGASGKHLSIVK